MLNHFRDLGNFISDRVGLDPIYCKSSLTSNGTEEVLRMAVHQASESNKTEILDHGYDDNRKLIQN